MLTCIDSKITGMFNSPHSTLSKVQAKSAAYKASKNKNQWYQNNAPVVKFHYSDMLWNQGWKVHEKIKSNAMHLS